MTGEAQITQGANVGTPRTLAPVVRCLIADMAVALADFESAAWDGDPRRRSDDELCMKSRKLIDQANTVVEATKTWPAPNKQ